MSLVFMNAIINIHMFLLGENPNIDTKVNDLVSWYLLFVYVKVKYIYFGVIYLSSERVLEKLKCSNSYKCYLYYLTQGVGAIPGCLAKFPNSIEVSN